MRATGRELLTDNPLLARERRRWWRRGWLWVPVALMAWLPMSYLARSPDAAMMLGAISLWQGALLSTVQATLRPDIALALFFVYLSVHNAGWHSVRQHLGVTLTTPGQVIVAKVAGPLGLLVALHLVGGYFYYSHLTHDPTLVLGPAWPNGPRLHVAYVVMPVAMVEDMLFASVCVLVALEQFLAHADAFTATFRALGWLLLVCVGIAVCQWSWEVAVYFAPLSFFEFLVFNPAEAFLLGNAAWFALALPLELAIIRATLGRLVRRLPQDLGREG